MTFPEVSVVGPARERGRQYGEQARERVRRSVEAYREVFAHYATWDWAQVLATARPFEGPIAAFAPWALEEMHGIAEGAGVPADDVLAVNVRTEVMFAAKARAAGATLPRVAECTAFAAVQTSPDGHAAVLAGQNWDWLPHAFETVVLLRAEPDDGPAFVTVVEAGLLAKAGVNAAGLAVMTNALVTSLDLGEPGVPYHVMLRALLGATTPTAALETLQRQPRASSANYLLAHRDGLALDVEALPGGFDRLSYLDPDERGVLVHTNHLLAPPPDVVDVGPWAMTDTVWRRQRALALLRHGDVHHHATWERVLTDHAGAPHGVCCHPDPAEPLVEQGATVASLVVDLAAGRILLADGPPCTSGYAGRPLPAAPLSG